MGTGVLWGIPKTPANPQNGGYKVNQIKISKNPINYIGSIWEAFLGFYIYATVGGGNLALINLETGGHLNPPSFHHENVVEGATLVAMSAEITIKL